MNQPEHWQVKLSKPMKDAPECWEAASTLYVKAFDYCEAVKDALDQMKEPGRWKVRSVSVYVEKE